MGCCYTALAHAHVATGQSCPRALCLCGRDAGTSCTHTHTFTHLPLPNPISIHQHSPAHLNDAWPHGRIYFYFIFFIIIIFFVVSSSFFLLSGGLALTLIWLH